MIFCFLDVGNEEFLNSTKIVGDVIKEVLDDGSLGDDLFFWLDYAYECQDECKSRYIKKYARLMSMVAHRFVCVEFESQIFVVVFFSQEHSKESKQIFDILTLTKPNQT